jgi:stage V sporulation protein G
MQRAADVLSAGELQSSCAVLAIASLIAEASDTASVSRGGGNIFMEITDVRVFPVGEEKLKAYVTITLDNCFVVRDLKVISGASGLFIAMPAKKRKDGTYKDIAHPLNADTRDRIERVILSEYEKQRVRIANGVQLPVDHEVD